MRPLLGKVKLAIFTVARGAGAFSALLESQWRRRRLCILCYHGVSLDDEHRWNPKLFVSPATFRRRMETLARLGCRALPLEQALALLTRNELPPKSVVITFDDGFYGVLARAQPVLRDLGFPATVYLTTYHSLKKTPVFRLACSYLLWKYSGVACRISGFTGADLHLRGATPADRAQALTAIDREVEAAQPDGAAKQAWLERLAAGLGADFAALREARILQLLTPEEARGLTGDGIEIQLHTHRHRSPAAEELYRAEILENREAIQTATGTLARHLCYPSGVYTAAAIEWLKRLDVASATTCHPGLCTAASNPLALPRYLDEETFSDLEFEAWVCGAAALGRRQS